MKIYVSAVMMENVCKLLQSLIRIPSENNGVTGYENECLTFFYRWLQEHDINAQLIYLDDIPEFDRHPGRLVERNLHNRPCVIAELSGTRPGKTLLLLAHADTVPVGDLAKWNDNPFSGKIEDGRIYGRGSGDDKWGIAMMGGLLHELKQNGCDFPGKVVIAAVPDEEFGGGNGTVSAFVIGIKADYAIYLDGGSNETIWYTGLGGGFCTVSGGDTELVRKTILKTKTAIRERLNIHPDFGAEFFKIIEKQFFLIDELTEGMRFFYDILPGEDEAELKRLFEAQLPGCSFRWMSRFLKASPGDRQAPLVQALTQAFQAETGRLPAIMGGIHSDQGLVIVYGRIPCILFGCGRRGMEGAVHQPNEFIEISALKEVYGTIIRLIWHSLF
jgi:acetylornithine deacetylase/succinyl-diaminopimelate desuccinylase-like protein